MTGPHGYCRPCDAWYREAGRRKCPECGEALEMRTFRYPEDVFGPPLEGEAPLASRDLEVRPNRGSRARGILYLALGHIALVIFWRNPDIGMAALFIGITQLIYAVPMMIFCGVRGQYDTVSGIALGAGITFMLNAACFGVVCGGL